MWTSVVHLFSRHCSIVPFKSKKRVDNQEICLSIESVLLIKIHVIYKSFQKRGLAAKITFNPKKKDGNYTQTLSQ